MKKDLLFVAGVNGNHLESIRTPSNCKLHIFRVSSGEKIKTLENTTLLGASDKYYAIATAVNSNKSIIKVFTHTDEEKLSLGDRNYHEFHPQMIEFNDELETVVFFLKLSGNLWPEKYNLENGQAISTGWSIPSIGVDGYMRKIGDIIFARSHSGEQAITMSRYQENGLKTIFKIRVAKPQSRLSFISGDIGRIGDHLLAVFNNLCFKIKINRVGEFLSTIYDSIGQESSLTSDKLTNFLKAEHDEFVTRADSSGKVPFAILRPINGGLFDLPLPTLQSGLFYGNTGVALLASDHIVTSTPSSSLGRYSDMVRVFDESGIPLNMYCLYDRQFESKESRVNMTFKTVDKVLVYDKRYLVFIELISGKIVICENPTP